MGKMNLSLGAAELVRLAATQIEHRDCQRNCKHYNYERGARFDETIIARQSMPKRVAFYAVAILTMSGILPVAIATFQIWLYDAYGFFAFWSCMAVDAAVIYWLVRHAA